MADQLKKRKISITLENLRELEKAFNAAAQHHAHEIPFRLAEAIRRVLVEIDVEL